MSDQEQNLEMINAGQTARMLRGQSEDWLIGREDDILQNLCTLYKTDQLTDDKLRGSIGEIVALRDFRIELETRIRKGVAASEKELGSNG